MYKIGQDQNDGQQDWQKTDVRVLGQILAAQNILFVLPDSARIAEFFAQALVSIPGVTSCRVCLGDASAQVGLESASCRECEALRKEAGELIIMPSGFKCRLAEQQDMGIITLEIYEHTYGFFVFRTDATGVFESYRPFINNLANYIALSLENRLQKNFLLKSKEKLTVQRRQLQVTNSEIGTLVELSSEIGSLTRIDELSTRALDIIIKSEFVPVEDHGVVFLIDGDEMKLVGHRGYSQAFIDLHKGMKVGQCLCGLAVKTGQIITSTNSEADDRHSLKDPDMMEHGHIIFPLKSMNRVIGAIDFQLPADVVLEDHKVELLSSMCSRIAIAMNNVMLYEKTREQSLHDALTGLANRNLLHRELKKNFALARRNGRKFSLIMMDLDHFKNYNDVYGHLAGDKLLIEIAKLISSEAREVDLAVRFGGEEFLLVLPETGLPGALELAYRIRQKIEAIDFYPAKKPVKITVSLGVAVYDKFVPDGDALISYADKALYKAKNAGRNKVVAWGRQASVGKAPQEFLEEFNSSR